MNAEESDLAISRTDDPWDVVADTPDEAENLRLRSDLMDAIIARIDEIGLTQERAAARLNVTQPRISDLYRGKIDKFSLDSLINLGHGVGVRVAIEVDPIRVAG